MSNKIDSNTTGFSYAEEAGLGQLPATPIWRGLNVNSFPDFGGQTSLVARSTLNPSRQKQKGEIVDLDATGGLNHDFIPSQLTRIMQGFFFAAAREKADTQPFNGAQVPLTAVTGTTVSAATGLAAFKAGDIVLLRGFAMPTNNRTVTLSGAAAGSLTTTGLTAEAAPPAGARANVVGFEFATGDVVPSLAGALFRLTATAGSFLALGLTVGEWVYLGDDVTGSRLPLNTGYARVSAVTDKVLSFDQTTFVASAESGAGVKLRMMFGRVIRNEKNPALIQRRTYQFERTLGKDNDGPQAEYVIGACANQMTLSIGTAEKMAGDFGFVAINHETRAGAVGPKAGTRVDADATAPFYNTSSDILRLYVGIIDPLTLNPGALFGYATEANITINNGVTPNKAVGKLGAFDTSAGDFEVSGTLTAYFSSVAAINAIRNNSDVTTNYIGAKDNAGWVFDMPLVALNGGRANVQKDQAIMLPLESSAAENKWGYTAMFVEFDYLPNVAMTL